MLKVSEAAQVLECSEASVRRWSNAGFLPTYRTPGGQRRYRGEDLERVLAEMQEHHDEVRYDDDMTNEKEDSSAS